jgi:peptidyl-tRNA hydrolase, PTH1 family
MVVALKAPRVIVGLGNPGNAYVLTRHNVGFRVVEALARKYDTHWQKRDAAEVASAVINGHNVLLVKPQSFMNNSGIIVPFLCKHSKQDGWLVVHDELELPFGKIAFKISGSAKGHNGLRSLIAAGGDAFMRLRCGIGRPSLREDVPHYVLQEFSESQHEVESLIDRSIHAIEGLYNCRN